MAAFLRAAGMLAANLLLASCLVTPGRFESSLDIRADRQFTFTYKGEILVSDIGKGLGSLPSTDESGDDESGHDEAPKDESASPDIAHQPKEPAAALAKRDSADEAQEMEGIAEALRREKGFRSARYMGNRRFEIDYAISGRLTHAFLFPFNPDAQIVLPFIVVELRGDDRVRVKAPGYANGSDKSQNPMGSRSSDEAARALNGTFTLTTDAEILSQNQEDGAQTVPQGKRILWTITPRTSDAPTATLRVKP